MLKTMLLTTALLAGLPWLRGTKTEPVDAAPKRAAAAAAMPDRVELLAADSDAYQALAIPKSYKTAVDASLRLLVFRGGLCVRDRGIVRAHTTDDGNDRSAIILEETGVAESVSVSPDARDAVVVSTRYVSRVDITPGQTSVAGDTVKSETILTLVDPTHPDGRWQITLEKGRWASDVLVLPAGSGIALTTFVPRTGPLDFRILDATGRERMRVPEEFGQTIRMEAAPGGGFAAAEMSFREGPGAWDRGVTIFDIAKGTQWTYGWTYGVDAEPLSWTLGSGGVLSLKLAAGTRRFDPSGRRL